MLFEQVKKIFSILFRCISVIIISITSCTSSSKAVKNTNSIHEGKYYGNGYCFSVFVNVFNDTAYADWIEQDKVYRDLYSDTLIKTDDMFFQGSFSSITIKNKIFIDFPEKSQKVKIRENENYYNNNIDEMKIRGFLASHFNEYNGTPEELELIYEKYFYKCETFKDAQNQYELYLKSIN